MITPLDLFRFLSARTSIEPRRRRIRRRACEVAHAVDALEGRILLAAVNPYVQNPAQDAMTIIWFTQENVPGTLTVRGPGGAEVFSGASTPVLANALAYHPNEVPSLPGGVDPGPPYKHSLRVTGLTAGTQYDYTVTQGGNTFNSHFRTVPESDSSVRFVIYSDSETEPESTGNRTAWEVPSAVPPGSTGRPPGLTNYVVDQTVGYRENLNLIKSRNPDFIGIAGDLVESGGEQRDWDEFWRHNSGELNDIASSVPIIAAPGNHENYGGPGGLGGYTDDAAIRARNKFQTYFETPDNGSGIASFEDRFYRIDYGPVTYITLDLTNGLPHQSSEDTNFHLGAGPALPDFHPGSVQYEWLEAQLADAQANSQFTFVQFHHVPYSVGPHGFPPGNGVGFDPQSGVPVRVLTPLFAQYGVDAVFSGHDEQYQHSLVDGVHFYDLGMGGDGLRGPSSGPDGSTGLPSTNPFQEFHAHLDAPEIWNGNQLISGGKHYGHMEVDVFLDDDGNWKAELEPAYNFPLMDAAGNVIGWERRVYDDVVTLTAGSMIIDDGDSGFSDTGDWKVSPIVEGRARDIRHSAPGNGSRVATWEFTGLTPGASYEIAATWSTHINRATNAPYTILDSDGSTILGTFLKNQEQEPDDFEESGSNWERLGVVRVTGTTVTVELSNAADGYVIADAVRIIETMEMPSNVVIIDDGDPGFSTTAGWNRSAIGEGRLNDVRTNFSGDGSEVATWTFTGLTPGNYRVAATWSTHANRATNAPYRILDGATGDALETVLINQELEPDDFTDQGSNWEELAVVTITGSVLIVELSDFANQYVIADAVRIEPTTMTSLPVGTIIDNSDPGFSTEGSWNLSPIVEGHAGTVRTSPRGDGSNIARWTFTGLVAGDYRVSVTWSTHANRATNAPYTIFDGIGGPSLGTVEVNQELAPDDFTTFGSPWEDLLTVSITDNELVVELTNAANEYVIADAVRIQPV